jgi:thiamine biosynthesis lipoprotein
MPHHSRIAPAALAALLLATALPANATDGPARPVTWSGRTMGTYSNITLVTADSAQAAPLASAAHARFHQLDSLMTNWTTTSEVARLNREAQAGPTRVHDEVATVLAKCQTVNAATEGAMDITVEPLVRAWGFLGGKPHVPDSATVAQAFEHVGQRHVHFDPKERTLQLDPGTGIDLGGIAKGYAVEQVAKRLAAAGEKNALVDLSGNMAALGAPPGERGWRIGIRDPRGREPWFARVTLRDRAISTSGQYEQFVAANGHTYGHILDPRTGVPAQGVLSVTVIADSPFDTDAWDTGLFVLGPEEAMKIARAHPELAVIVVVPSPSGPDVVWVERSLRGDFALEPGAEARFIVRWF